jgi:hypothetical protein
MDAVVHGFCSEGTTPGGVLLHHAWQEFNHELCCYADDVTRMAGIYPPQHF